MGFIDRVQGHLGLKKEVLAGDVSEVEKTMDPDKFLVGVPDVSDIKTEDHLWVVADLFKKAAEEDLKKVKNPERSQAGQELYRRLQKALYHSKHWERSLPKNDHPAVKQMKEIKRMLTRYAGN